MSFKRSSVLFLLVGVGLPGISQALTYPSASTVLDEPVSIQTADGNSLMAYRAYESCTTWYWVPSTFAPLSDTQVFYENRPVTLDDTKVGLTSEYSFFVRANAPTEQERDRFRELIARELNHRGAARQTHYEGCRSDYSASDIELGVITAGSMGGRFQPGPKQPTGSNAVRTGYWTAVNLASDPDLGYNPASPIPVSLIGDMVDPGFEPRFSKALNNGLQLTDNFQLPNISIAFNKVISLAKGELRLSGIVSADFYSELEKTLRCTSHTVTHSGGRSATGTAVGAAVGYALGGPLGGVLGGIFGGGGGDSVDVTQDCEAPKWINTIKGCSEDDKNCDAITNELHITFTVDSIGDNKVLPVCLDAKCENPVNMTRAQLTRAMLLDQWLSGTFSASYDELTRETTLKEDGRNGRVTGRINQTYTVSENTIQGISLEASVLTAGLKGKVDSAPSIETLLTRNASLQCARKEIEDDMVDPDNAPIAGFYPFRRDLCSHPAGPATPVGPTNPVSSELMGLLR